MQLIIKAVFINPILFCKLIACPDGWYGFNCKGQCSANCGVSYRCDMVTGQCEGGCQMGFKGVTCDTRKSSFIPYMFISDLIKI